MLKYFNKDMLSVVKDSFLKKIDPALLLFLLFMLNYRISFKLIAIVGIYIYRPNFKIKKDGIFFFYLSMILLSIVNILFVNRDYSYNHLIVVTVGTLIWFICLFTHHQIKLWVNTTEPHKIMNTLKVLVIINFLVSMFDIIRIIFINKTINPYTQIIGPPYGISSGDLIGGVFGGMHLVNTILCCFLAIFFMYKRSFLYVLLCLVPFLLTGSNLGTIILTGLLLGMFLFNRDLILKYFAVFSIAIICIFYIKITPQNSSYMVKTIAKVKNQFTKKPDVIEIANIKNKVDQQQPTAEISPVKRATKEELISNYIKYKQKLINDSTVEKNKYQQVRVYNLISAFEKKRRVNLEKETDFVFHKKDSLQLTKLNTSFFEYGNLKKFDLEAESGKITSFKQTITFLMSDGLTALFGSGVGSFSSRLAFISSKIVKDSRILEMIPKYETTVFRNNHEAIFKYLLFLDDETHSITNLPFCWYNQLLGEYGLIGLVMFLVFYLLFFIRKFPYLLSYGKILFISLLGFFFFDYWYERLSVVILFELLMLLDIKEMLTKKENNK